MSSEHSGRPLYDAAGMRAVDRWAIETEGVTSLELMEAAGAAVAGEVERLVAERAAVGPVRIVCGKGNNGGDGFVVARLLRAAGHEVDVLLLWPDADSGGDAAINLERLDGAWKILDGDPMAALAGSAAIVDAIFGTGFAGEPDGPVGDVIDAIVAHGEAGVPVVACDVPSGVNASTGEIAARTVRATVTVSFHAAKVGMFVAPGKERCGELVVAPIGIPDGAPVASAAGTIAADVLALAPERSARSTKFSSGEVLIVGGSRGMTGAPCMAAMAASRGGAGYVTVGVPASLEPVFEIKLTEQMSFALDDVDGSLGAAAAAPILERAERVGALLIGPGIGRRPHTARLVRELVPRVEAPLVIDADGLYALGTVLEIASSRTEPTILTPHAGELGRLLGIDSAEVAEHRLEAARSAAERSGATVVLKGDDTIVVDGSRVAVNELAAPGLATAGTGDVLAGLTAALLARGMAAFEATMAAVYGHARAGRLAAANRSAESVIATDVIDALSWGLDPEAELG